MTKSKKKEELETTKNYYRKQLLQQRKILRETNLEKEHLIKKYKIDQLEEKIEKTNNKIKEIIIHALDNGFSENDLRYDLSQKRTIRNIAQEIVEESPDIKKCKDAIPYLMQMQHLDSVDKFSYNESAPEIVNGFLIHTRCWRGQYPRKIKAELRKILKETVV